MVKWSMELSEYGIVFENMGAIKGQVLADFVVELNQSAFEDIVFSP